ncbi:hypothetical protein GCM10010398_08600 [Streptomyces fimbriatus]
MTTSHSGDAGGGAPPATVTTHPAAGVHDGALDDVLGGVRGSLLWLVTIPASTTHIPA